MTVTSRDGKGIFGVIEDICEKYPCKPAVIYLGEKFSYSELRDLVRRFAGALSDLGVGVNDKVMIYIANCPQFLVAYFGIQEIGAIPVPVSPIYTPFELEYMVDDSGAETIICQDTNFRYVKEVSKKKNLRRIIVTNLADLLPWWKRAIGKALDKVPKGAVKKSSQVYFFSDLIRHRNQPSKVAIKPEEHLASILYTGGTTGSPRGVPSSHAKMLCSLKDFRDLTKDHIPEGGDDVLLIAISLFHMMGEEAILGWGLGKGISVVLMPVPQVDAILEAIQIYKVTLFVGVPALYRMILENDRMNLYDLTSLKYCWSGGDVLPPDLFKRWHETFHIPLYQNYGTTEVGCISLSPLDRFPVIGSIGLPIPSKKVKVVDPDTLEEVPTNKVGELFVTSEYGIQSCYWNKPEETSECFVEMSGRTWNLTNDYVQIDENGLLFYVDRSADIIKYKGYRVACSEIEAVLQDHKAVREACVIGVPDPSVGELIKAIVVLKGATRGVDASELIKWCRERLAPYKIPDYIEFRDALPKSKVGKLLRREIREEERRRWLRRK
jgi:long-chain acyl-CoA synthetase